METRDSSQDFNEAFVWWNSYISANCRPDQLDTAHNIAELAQKIAAIDVAPVRVTTPRYRRLLRLVQEQEIKESPCQDSHVERVMTQWAKSFLEFRASEGATLDELVSMLSDAYSSGWNGAQLGYGLDDEHDAELGAE